MTKLLGATTRMLSPELGATGTADAPNPTPTKTADTDALARDVELTKRAQLLAEKEAALRAEAEAVERGKAGLSGVQGMVQGLREADPESFVMLAEAIVGKDDRNAVLATAERIYDALNAEQAPVTTKPATPTAPHPVAQDPDLLALKKLNQTLASNGLTLERAVAIALGTSNEIAGSKTEQSIGGLVEQDAILKAVFARDAKLRGSFIQGVKSDVERAIEAGISYPKALKEAFEQRASTIRSTLEAVASSMPGVSMGGPPVNALLGIQRPDIKQPVFDEKDIGDEEKRVDFINKLIQYEFSKGTPG